MCRCFLNRRLVLTPKHPPLHTQNITEVFCMLWDFRGPVPSGVWKPHPPGIWQGDRQTKQRRLQHRRGEEVGGWEAWGGGVSHTRTPPLAPCDLKKKLWWSSERHRLNYLALFLLRRRVFTCTYTESRALFFERVCAQNRQRVLCIHLNIQFYKKQLHSWSLQSDSFVSLWRAETSNTTPAFDPIILR